MDVRNYSRNYSRNYCTQLLPKVNKAECNDIVNLTMLEGHQQKYSKSFSGVTQIAKI